MTSAHDQLHEHRDIRAGGFLSLGKPVPVAGTHRDQHQVIPPESLQ